MTTAITAIEGPKGVAFVLELEGGAAVVEWKGSVVGVFETVGMAKWGAKMIATRGKAPEWM
jgi:hypothetical protein